MAGARIRVTVKDTDRGWKALGKRLKAAAGETIAKAGVLERRNQREAEASTTAAPSNAELAVIHEFGSPAHGIPQRAFIRPAFDSGIEQNSWLLNQAAGQFMDGKITLRKALGLVGAKLASDIKKFITTGQVQPPDSPRTLAEKRAKGRRGSSGSPRTLVDTGQMVRSITWSVEKQKDGEGSK